MDEAALGGFDPAIEVVYRPDLAGDRPALLEAVGAADGLIVRNRTRVDEALLAAATRLRVVGRLGVGLDNIDLAACRARDIAVRPATGANAVAVAEFVIGAALVLVRGVFHDRAAMLAGDWPRERLVGGELAGRTLGLMGMGGIARLVRDRAIALGMAVAGHDPFLDAEDPAWEGVHLCPTAGELCDLADVLSLHVPLTAETRNLIDADALTRLPAGAVVINTARGGVLDEGALAAALRSGHLGGAALDVFAEEPLAAAAAERFAEVPNLILTPHVGGVTREANARVSAVTVKNVMAVLARVSVDG